MIEIEKHLTLLLIEDDPGHVRLVQKNLRRANITGPIVVLNDGQQGLDYLFNRGEFAGQSPHLYESMLVLLDLNLPVLDGYQVLAQIKQNEQTRHIPVIVLSTTDDPRDVDKCYSLGCNAYMAKPVEYTAFAQAVQKLGRFLPWIEIPRGDEQ